MSWWKKSWKKFGVVEKSKNLQSYRVVDDDKRWWAGEKKVEKSLELWKKQRICNRIELLMMTSDDELVKKKLKKIWSYWKNKEFAIVCSLYRLWTGVNIKHKELRLWKLPDCLPFPATAKKLGQFPLKSLREHALILKKSLNKRIFRFHFSPPGGFPGKKLKWKDELLWAGFFVNL